MQMLCTRQTNRDLLGLDPRQQPQNQNARFNTLVLERSGFSAEMIPEDQSTYLQDTGTAGAANTVGRQTSQRHNTMFFMWRKRMFR